MNHLEVCDHLQRLYDAPTDPYWDFVNPVDGAWVVTKLLPDGTLLILWRGSRTMLDWYLDAVSETPTEVDLIGWVPKGFWLGVSEARDAVLGVIVALGDKVKSIIVAGHSLGAARACEHAGWLKASAPTLAPLVRWLAIACPRPGFAKLVQVLGAGSWYRNREDPVTFVPWDGGLLKHPGTEIHVDAPPQKPDAWGPLASHHLVLYRQAISTMNPIPEVT